MVANSTSGCYFHEQTAEREKLNLVHTRVDFNLPCPGGLHYSHAFISQCSENAASTSNVTQALMPRCCCFFLLGHHFNAFGRRQIYHSQPGHFGEVGEGLASLTGLVVGVYLRGVRGPPVEAKHTITNFNNAENEIKRDSVAVQKIYLQMYRLNENIKILLTKYNEER